MIPAGVKVLLSAQPIDFRKGMDGLLGLVRDAGHDPFNGTVYVFRSKRADRLRMVWFDGTGVCLVSKRLETGSFCWPKVGQARIRLNQAQALALLDGLDWKRVRPEKVARPRLAG
ncbi:IS66 family insertion sequence element accessory protein TnpB [Asticcacaulis sp. DW145]|jgi:transposase|uniref:IS66 family insertion sequence element accessory protein TnpB n=1 Tax=Asticcacaulis sp. DW145 TaxID=3095608 RepID=UPI0030886350|nr:IS66 family insertion sequence element accessory protein TnpB [Asticcacaulis sp. DW145]